MIIYKCDKCGKTTETKKGKRNPSCPEGWFTLIHGQYSTGVEYHICPDCRESLGIPEDYNKACEHVGDQLLEILTEIVQEEVANCQP